MTAVTTTAQSPITAARGAGKGVCQIMWWLGKYRADLRATGVQRNRNNHLRFKPAENHFVQDYHTIPVEDNRIGEVIKKIKKESVVGIGNANERYFKKIKRVSEVYKTTPKIKNS